MPERPINRRNFISGSAIAGSAALLAARLPDAHAQLDAGRLPTDYGPCPRKLEDFLKYIVQLRTAQDLSHLKTDGPAPGSASGGEGQDGYICFSAAHAYRYKWSRLYKNQTVRQRAYSVLDATCKYHADGKWDDGGLNSYFGFHGLALAVLAWKENGDVDAPRLQFWTEVVTKSAEDGLLHLHYGPYQYSPLTAQYANPEMYFLAGLAAAWKITGNDRYKIEAEHGLRRYDEWLFKGGGVAYFLESSPQHGYQQMAVKSVALYWDITRDPYAVDFMKRLAPYYPNVIHRSGLMTDAEQPQIKHVLGMIPNPAVPAMIALVTGDAQNRYVADCAVPRQADSVDNKNPSWGKTNITWYNPQAVTYTAAALRLMEHTTLPAPVPLEPRRIFLDDSFRGVRSQWDDFMAASTTRQMSDSPAGAYIADTKERLVPLDSALDGVYFEAIQAKPGAAKPLEFVCTEWAPIITYAAAEGLASRSHMTKLISRFWGEIPRIPGDRGDENQEGDWTTVQHWAVWQDYLVGFGSLLCHQAGGTGSDLARVRWRLAPVNRKLDKIEQTDTLLRFQYGRLLADLTCLDQQGGGSFKPADIGETPHLAWTPLLTRPAPWAVGDYLNVATVLRPANAAGTVQTKALKYGAAALFLEPGGRKGHVWVVNLTRNTQHFLMTVPPGMDIHTYKRDVHLPPVPPNQPAHAGLIGGEAATFAFESTQPVNPTTLLAGLRQDNNNPFKNEPKR